MFHLGGCFFLMLGKHLETGLEKCRVFSLDVRPPFFFFSNERAGKSTGYSAAMLKAAFSEDDTPLPLAGEAVK